MSLIAVEGPDEVGKTTLAKALVASLRDMGLDATYLAFPGHAPDTLGAEVYRLHHEYGQASLGPSSATTVQLLHLAAHAQSIEFFIRPALARGETVILDRFWWSLAVYGRYGGVANSVLNHLIAIERLLWADISPLLVVLLHRHHPLTSAISAEEFVTLASLYRDFASAERALTAVLDLSTEDGPEATLARLRSTVNSLFPGHASTI